MTRQRKYDYEIIKREYIYDAGSPPISYRDLAAKHGASLSLLTDRGAREKWTEQRDVFRKTLGIRVTEMMSDELSRFQVDVRERMMGTALKYLTKYEEALDAGEIKVTTRDMLGIAAMVRVLIGDANVEQSGEEGLLNEDTPMSPDAIREGLRLLESGDLSEPADEPGDAPAEPAPRTRQN